jgi:DNA replication and repair protein RecF
MRERLRLLKQGGLSQTAWLDTLEAKMAESGVAIAAARLQTIETLKQAKEWALGLFPKAALSIVGSCETDLRERSALEAEDRLQRRLLQSRSQDAESGRTHEGPHRSALHVLYVDKNRPAEQCSTGEQKALLISIVMAASRLQALRGDQVPILLLDEVVAHLDEGRRQALFEEILNLKIQAWMTGTDSDLFSEFGREIQHFKIAHGALEVV